MSRLPVSGPFGNLWIYLALFVATWAIYWQVRHFDFVEFDDPDYSGNVHVTPGLTREGVIWALTSGDAANWFPVTRISHLLDAQFFGQQSGLHHLTSLLFHALTVLLVFAFLNRATGARWRSALVAFLFALHPLHVESVAWVAERKDVLCAFFWFLTLLAYLRYAERPDLRRYLLVLVSFCLGLMSKPMMVSLPFVLLMLDFWPLRRLPSRISRQRALCEKIPFLVLAAGGAAIAYFTQSTGGTVELVNRSLGARAENALVSYVVYVGKMFWPARLAVLYPYPVYIPLWQAAGAGLAIAAVSILAVRWYRDLPYLAVGWFWYLGTLVPVIGLVQVGVQARADRYTYIPMVGLSIMLAWGLASAVERWPRARNFAVLSVAALCLAAAAVTWTQLRYWTNSESLYRHAIEVTEGNYTMHYGLGVVLSKIPGRSEEAISEYRAALRFKPDDLEAHSNLATVLLAMPNHLPEAIAEYRAALRTQPASATVRINLAAVHNNLGFALSKDPAQLAEAISEYRAALRIKPDFFEAHTNLADALTQVPGGMAEAIREYEAALRLAPDSADTRKKLAAVLSKMPDRLADAISQYRTVLVTNPASIEAHNGIAAALMQMPGHLQEAIAEYEAALKVQPDSAELHVNLGTALLKDPSRAGEAISEYQSALRINPDSVEAHYNLAFLLAGMPGRQSEAIPHLEAVERIKPDLAVRQLLIRLEAAK